MHSAQLRSHVRVAAVAMVAAAFLAVVGGCKGDQKVASVTVAELDGLIGTGNCQVVDANGDATRQRMGVIPGATLLSGHDSYPLSQLPVDKAKKLVFYCANESCGASHVAAERALEAGHTDVAILPAGIAGWKNAGKPVKTL